MKLWKKINLFFIGVLVGCLLFSIPSTTQGFVATTIEKLGLLMKRIDEPQWKIGYNFTVDCPAEFREQEEQLKEIITKALQTWLQPLREQYPDREFTDDFVLVRLPDVAKCKDNFMPLRELDTRITFDCKGKGFSFAALSLGAAPDLCIRTKERAATDRTIAYTLVHELGHAFGMEDTYIRNHLLSSGGLAHTMDKQPASVMAVNFSHVLFSPFGLGEDDKNGIIWLYKYLHEDHPADDCFFPDYVAKGNGRCEPEYPLIFEAKHGVFQTVQQILTDDPTLELNARDSQGMSALHYAVQRGSAEMVEVLLAQATIKVNILDKHGRTPAKLARELQHVDLAALIEAHPSAKLPPQPVERARTLATTWGAVKRR